MAGATEDEIYGALKLDCIPPEMRENCGEIEARRRAQAAEADHGQGYSRRSAHAHRRDRRHVHHRGDGGGGEGARLQVHRHHRSLEESGLRQRARRQARRASTSRAFSAANEQIDGITIMAGIEVDILADGELDLSDSVLEQMDVVVASVHSAFNQEPQQMTDRLLRALDNKNVSILGHPTGRLLLRRDAYRFDMDAILKAALKNKVAMELNAYPDRLDLNDVHLRMARERGVKIVINTDAHHTSHFEKIKYGILQARRAWLTPADVLNTLPEKEFRKGMAKQGSGVGG